MVYRFADFELDDVQYCLSRSGAPVAVEKRIFDLILYLVANSDRVVSKEEIFHRIWAGRKVAPGSLTVAISAARRALGDDADQQKMIATSPGRGYRFVAELAVVHEPSLLSLPAAVRRSLSDDFIGRSAQIQAFSDILNQSQPVHARVMTMSGEAGIGKSRLLAEYSRLASGAGVPMLVVHCPESERTPFLWPWVQLISRLLDTHPAGSDLGIARSQRVVLANVLPDLFPDAATEPLADPDAARFQLFDALAALLRVLCASQLRVLAFDDIHRADDGTARLLPFVCAALRDLPLVLIVTYRPDELVCSDVHSATVASLSREPYSVSINLTGLTPADTKALASILRGSAVNESVARQLHERTAGNPLYIHQMLPMFANPAQEPAWDDVPLSLANAILHRVRGLSPGAQAVLRTAAVFGRSFPVKIIELICAPLAIASSLQEAAQCGLLVVPPNPRGRAAFTHVLVRDVLYGSLADDERRRLHLQIGTLLDTAGAAASESSAAEIARHLAASNSPSALQRALELSIEAAELASLRSAHEDAAHHLALATEILEDDPHSQPKLCHLLILRGAAECRSGRRNAAQVTFREAAVLAVRLGASRELARAALGVAPGFLAAEAGVSDPGLEELLTTALHSLNSRDSDLRALVASRLAMALHWAEREDAVCALMETARESANEAVSDEVLLHVRFAEWFCEWQHDSLQTRHETAKEIHRLAEGLSDREMTLVGMVLRMVGALERAEIADFDRYLERFDELARHLRQPQSLWYTAMYRSMRALIDGRLEDAARCQSEFSAIASRVNDANAFHSLAAQTSILAWQRGALDTALSMIADGVSRYPSIRGFRAGLAWAYTKLSRLADARREFEILATHDFRDLPQRFDWSTAIGFSAETCVALGDQRRAEILHGLLLPYSNHLLVMGLGVGTFGPADRLIGLLEAVLGRVDEARWSFERAIELCDSRGIPGLGAQARADYAWLLAKQGRTMRGLASQLAREAAAFARVMGMKALEEESAAALSLLGDS